MKLIYLEWQDAHTQNGWQNEDDIKDFCDDHEFIIKECGWLVEENKRQIVIGTALKEKTDYWDKQILNLHKIPKTWIKKRKILKV
jgi:hypothetical protein